MQKFAAITGHVNKFFYTAGIVLILVLTSRVTFANEGNCTPVLKETYYKVQAGDQLGKILYRFNVGRLWGKHHSVNKTAKLNEIEKKDAIFPGQVILIPFRCEEDVQANLTEERGLVRWILPEKREISSEEAAVQYVQKTVDIHLQEPSAENKKDSPEKIPTALAGAEAKAAQAGTQVSEDDDEASAFVFEAIGQYASLDGQDVSNGTKGKLLSKLNTGLRLQWDQVWSRLSRSTIFVQTLQTNLYSEKHGTALNDEKQTLTRFGVGYFASPSSRWELGATLEEGPLLFYRGSLAASGLELNAVNIFRFHPQASYLLKQGKHLSFSLLAGISYYGAASFDNYSISAGSGYDVGFLMKHRFSSGSDIHCRPFYSFRSQNTSLLKYSESEAEIICGFTWWLK